MSDASLEDRIASVRRFNRFYTQKIGVLDEGMLHSPFSLAEARVLYELAHRDRPTAGEVARDLLLDAGYLSRILRGFHRQGLIERVTASDRRRRYLTLTAAGKAAFAPLDSGMHEVTGGLLRTLPERGQCAVVKAMRTIEGLLGAAEPVAECLLRPHRPGDLGWVVSRHGALYAEEYDWDETFEAYVAEIAARFLENLDPAREHCWIAEQGDERAGSVALVRESETTARLRLLLVEPTARGGGVGRRLIDACLSLARETGYQHMVLSTCNVLTAARHLYDAAGFRLTEASPMHRFGHDLIDETWELAL